MSQNNYDNNLSQQENSNLNNHGNEENTNVLNNDRTYDEIHAHEIPNFEKYDEMVFNPLRYQGADNIGDLDNNIMECNYLTPRQLKDKNLLSDEKFSILNLNIRSLRKNFDKIKECLKEMEHYFTIIGVSETHLKEKPTQYYDMPGYNFEYTNRVDRGKGGVGMYVSQLIEYKVRKDLNKTTPNFESCFIEIDRRNKKNIVVGVIYRSFTSIDYFIHEMNPIIETISNENKEIYIMGDFNIDLLKEEKYRQIHDYLNMILSYSMLPTITKPTRITENSATLIDNILTNNYDVASAILVTDTSDHFPTVVSTSSNVRKKETKSDEGKCYKRNYTNDNVNYLKESMSSIKWAEILHGDSVDEDYNIVVSTITDLIDKCIPLRKCNRSRKKDPMSPWITKGLLRSINNKNKLYKIYKNSATEENLNNYKSYRNKLHNLIRKMKRQYFERKFQQSKNKMKQTWININNILGRAKKKSHQSKFKNDLGQLNTDPQVIANEFNNFFVNIGPKLANEIGTSHQNYFKYLSNPIQNNFFMLPVFENEIIKIIGNFDQNKSPGHDEISNFLIKKIAKEVSIPLAAVFNLSITKGIVPKDLKKAKVIPIYKKDNAELYSNYRPVSILPCFSKILERIIFNRCLSFIEKYEILNDCQFGFRTGYSTEMAITDLVDKVYKAVDQNETTLGIYLDLSKAFDTINHDVLLYKLEHYGFRGISLEWFKSYLSDRTQYVYYNSYKSCIKNATCGVPQGSILGPLLFILYVNDIINTSTILNFVLFADDTTILYSHKDLDSKIGMINNELQKVTDWFKANKLSINVDKTNFMIMGTPQKTFKFKNDISVLLDGRCLSRVNKTKFLGIIIDENLSFKYHVEAISNTISRNIGILNKLKYFVPKRILKCIYCSIISPFLSYGILAWGNTHTIYLKRLLKLQKRAVRNITLSDFRDHSAPLFKDLKFLRVTDIYLLNLGIFMYKHSMGILPKIFLSYFTKRHDYHNYMTRNIDDYQLIKNNTKFSSKGVRSAGPDHWNKLNSDVKKSKTLNTFKIKLKETTIMTYG